MQSNLSENSHSGSKTSFPLQSSMLVNTEKSTTAKKGASITRITIC